MSDFDGKVKKLARRVKHRTEVDGHVGKDGVLKQSGGIYYYGIYQIVDTAGKYLISIRCTNVKGLRAVDEEYKEPTFWVNVGVAYDFDTARSFIMSNGRLQLYGTLLVYAVLKNGLNLLSVKEMTEEWHRQKNKWVLRNRNTKEENVDYEKVGAVVVESEPVTNSNEPGLVQQENTAEM